MTNNKAENFLSYQPTKWNLFKNVTDKLFNLVLVLFIAYSFFLSLGVNSFSEIKTAYANGSTIFFILVSFPLLLLVTKVPPSLIGIIFLRHKSKDLTISMNGINNEKPKFFKRQLTEYWTENLQVVQITTNTKGEKYVAFKAIVYYSDEKQLVIKDTISTADWKINDPSKITTLFEQIGHPVSHYTQTEWKAFVAPIKKEMNRKRLEFIGYFDLKENAKGLFFVLATLLVITPFSFTTLLLSEYSFIGASQAIYFLLPILVLCISAYLISKKGVLDESRCFFASFLIAIIFAFSVLPIFFWSVPKLGEWQTETVTFQEKNSRDKYRWKSDFGGETFLCDETSSLTAREIQTVRFIGMVKAKNSDMCPEN